MKTVETESSPPISFREWWTPLHTIALFVVCFLAVFQFGQSFTRLSPYDEDMHLGYTLFVADLELPPRGTVYRQEVFEEWACRGFHDKSQATAVPRCGSEPYDPNQFPALGVHRSSSPPLYYALVAAISAVPRMIVGDGPLGVMRLTGSVFLFFGLAGALEASRLLGSRRGWAFAVALSIPLASRFIMLQTSTVTNDALVFALGGLLIAAALRYTSGANRVWLPIVFALAAGSTKETAAFPTMAAACFVLLDTSSMRPTFERARTAVTMSLIGFGLPLAWGRIVAFRSPDDWTSPIGRGNALDVEGSPWDEIFADPFGFLPPIPARGIPVATGLNSTVTSHWGTGLGGVILLAIGGALVVGCVRRRQLAWSVVLSSIAAALLLQGYLVVGRGGYFPGLSPRYGIGLIAPSLVLLILLFQHTRGLRVLGAATISASVAVILYSLVT